MVRRSQIPPDDITIAKIEAEERRLQGEIKQLLERAKRECSPGFAERAETWLRSRRLLPPDDKAN
jgi:hypothetical protein